jgi:hypothetical protein
VLDPPFGGWFSFVLSSLVDPFLLGLDFDGSLFQILEYVSKISSYLPSHTESSLELKRDELVDVADPISNKYPSNEFLLILRLAEQSKIGMSINIIWKYTINRDITRCIKYCREPKSSTLND